jgi:drug/metabolite transporter (DMT)-like permease
MPLGAALFGAVALSFSAIFFALSEVSPVTGTFFRAIYALPVLTVLWWKIRHHDKRSRKARLLGVGAGLMLGLDFTFWHVAIGYMGAGLATLVANSQVVIVALFAWVIFGERPSRVLGWAIPLVLVGLTLVSGTVGADSFGVDPLQGTIVSILSAVCYAGFLLAYRRSNRSQSPAVGSLLDATLGTALVTVIIAPVFGGIDLAPTWPGHGWLAALAVSCQVVGLLAIGYALPRLPAAETSTLILLQPVLTMVWGALILTERPSAVQLLGVVLVLAGVGSVATLTRRRRLGIPAPTV